MKNKGTIILTVLMSLNIIISLTIILATPAVKPEAKHTEGYYTAFLKEQKVSGVELNYLLDYNSGVKLYVLLNNGNKFIVEGELVRIRQYSEYQIVDYVYKSETDRRIIGYVVDEVNRPDFYSSVDAAQKP